MVALHLDPPAQWLPLNHHCTLATFHPHQLRPRCCGLLSLLRQQSEKCLDSSKKTLLFRWIWLARSLKHRTPLDFWRLLDYLLVLLLGVTKSELLIGSSFVVSNFIGSWLILGNYVPKNAGFKIFWQFQFPGVEEDAFLVFRNDL
jgi:hypothetical protein